MPTATETTTIKGREYRVELMKTADTSRADLIRRGWDGQFYRLVGTRGAAYVAFRVADGGPFEIVHATR